MTKGVHVSPNASTNKAYEIDVDDVANVPDCSQIQRQGADKELYSTPSNTEPIYELPKFLGLTNTPIAGVETVEKREPKGRQSQGRRSKTNDIYEQTDDESLLNGRSYTGYSYVCHGPSLVPRLNNTAYDNPVSATEGEYDSHEYEESNNRNSRFSENVVYGETAASTIKFHGIRDINTEAIKGEYAEIAKPQKHKGQRTTCVQRFSLLLGILATILALLALLMALKTINVNGTTEEISVAAKHGQMVGRPQNNETKLQFLREELLSYGNEWFARLNASIWKKLSTMRGPRGYNGTRGKDGPRGPQGQRGAPGLASICKDYSISRQGTLTPVFFKTISNSTTSLYLNVGCTVSSNGLVDQSRTKKTESTFKCVCRTDRIILHRKNAYTCTLKYKRCKLIRYP